MIMQLCNFQNVTNINCWHFLLSQLLKPPKKEKKKYYAPPPPSYGYGYQVSLAICWKLVLAQNIDYTNFRTTRMLTPMVDTTIMPGISYQDLNLLWRLKLLSQLKFVTVLYLLWCQQLESKSWQKSVEKTLNHLTFKNEIGKNLQNLVSFIQFNIFVHALNANLLQCIHVSFIFHSKL